MIIALLIYVLFLAGMIFYIVSVGYLVYFLLNELIEKAKKDMILRNNILSCIWFLMDMGPSVSSVAAVGIVIMPEGATTIQLTVVFILGIMMKRIGRKLKEVFYKKLGYEDDNIKPRFVKYGRSST